MKAKLKVLQVLTDTNFGGAGKYVLDICENIHYDLFEVYVILPYNSIMKPYFEKIKDIHLVEVEGIADQSFSIKGTQQLIRQIKKIKPDVLHSHASLSARIAAKWCGVSRVINTRHCLEPLSQNALKRQLKTFLNQHLSHKIIAVSAAVKSNLLQEGVDQDRIKLIYNGMSVRPVLGEDVVERLKAEYGIIQGQRVVTIVGRLEPVKGYEHFLEIIRTLLKATPLPLMVLIAGEGSLRASIEQTIKTEQLPIRLLGHVQHINELYEVSDVVVNTSNSEALCYALLEAMSYKKAVVAFDIEGVNEVITHNEDGYLVPFKDYDGFANRLKTLLENDDLRKSMGEKGLEKVMNKFSMQSAIEAMETLYREGRA